MNEHKTRSVFVAVVGRPNVGKSSLVNRLVGEKVAIVTPKPQTTRNRITGIRTCGPVQYVFVDTPGIHKPRTRLGQRMERSVKESMADGDVVLMLFEPKPAFNEAEEAMMAALAASGAATLAAVNKTDTLQEADALPLRIEEIAGRGLFQEIFPVSALTGKGCDTLLKALDAYAAPGPHFFPDDAYADMPEKQLAAEIVREKLLMYMQEEIPHGTAVEVERFHERENQEITDIEVVIYCEKKSHKGMIIGKGGAMLKKIASAARRDIEEMLATKVNLQCWVKVRDDWRDNERALNSLGFK